MANHRGGSGNFAEDRERASEAGRKGGQHSGGNFKNDPQRASEAGKQGGKNSHGGNKSVAGLISLPPGLPGGFFISATLNCNQRQRTLGNCSSLRVPHVCLTFQVFR